MSKIKALSQRTALIKRLNVYFGPEQGDENYPYSTQKNVLIREIIDNAVDILKKNKKANLIKKGNIRVKFNKDNSIEVLDSGSGIPTEISHTAEGIPASSLYLALGVLNAGTNYEDLSDTLGTNGVGGSGAQMLSEYMKVEVYKNNKIYCIDFKEGELGIFKDNDFIKAKDLTFIDIRKDNRDKEEKKLFPTGTKIKFKINDSLFKSKYSYDIEDLIDRMKSTSFLEDFITFYVYNENDGQEYKFNFGGGIEHIADLNSTNKITKIYNLSNSSNFEDDTIDISDKNIKVKTIVKETNINISFCYQNNYEYFTDSYVNTIKTKKNGVHVQAFEKAFTDIFNQKLQSMKGYISKSEKNLPIFQDYSEGLCLVISVSLPEPDFTNQIKEELRGTKVLKEFIKLYSECITKWINTKANQEDIKRIADKVMAAYKIRLKRKEEVDIKREKNKIKTSVMPSKLVDCEINYDENSEIYISEGDSASTAIKGSRNSKYQAILPIRGKILNVLKASPKKILSNQEIQDILKCLDAGVGDSYDHSKARYQKIIIATDADVDGDAIANLLILVFWKFCREAILKGCVYRILTPLYIINTKKQNYYCLNAEERDNTLVKLDKDNIKYTITRAKGLGESGEETLIYTGLDPRTRRIQRITVNDVEKAEEMLEIVMGEDTEIRKDWLRENPIVPEEL